MRNVGQWGPNNYRTPYCACIYSGVHSFSP
nr:MAG TPA: epoxyqueuosine reductase [Bacteriophage sp.]